MELRHIRYFVAVAEELNFTRAAARLHMAQPPLSTQIRRLEEELGARLFDRDKRRVFLTQAGRHLLDHARSILASVEAAKAEVRSAVIGEVGKLNLAYTASAMFTAFLPATIKRFRATHPQVLLTLHEMTSLDQLNAIHHRGIDAGILRKPDVPAPPGVKLEEWYRAPLIVALSDDHPLAKQRTIRVRDLHDQPLIMYPRGAGIGLYWHIIALCGKAGFRPHVAREVLEPSTIIGLVAAGVGIAIVPADTQSIQLKGVAYRGLLDKDAVSTLYLGFRSADTNTYLNVLLSALRKHPKGVGAKSERAPL